MLAMLLLQVRSLFTGFPPQPQQPALLWTSINRNSVSHLRQSHAGFSEEPQCRFYLAESSIPQAGLGVFTAVGLHKGDEVGIHDICLFVADMKAPEREWMQLRTHTFGRGSFFGQFEGKTNRAACEGMVTNYNTQPDHLVNTKIVSPYLPTNAGLDRATFPAAGSMTHHFGIHGEATDVITAGRYVFLILDAHPELPWSRLDGSRLLQINSELIIDYGDWTFDKHKTYTKPTRPVQWLKDHGWCIDNIDIRPATDPRMGRGAFVKRFIAAGQVVAPSPLQSFRDRKVFQDSAPEQLFVNYCMQPKGSKMIFYPYGQGVNLINHSSKKANVSLRWSTNPMHNVGWLGLSKDEFFKVSKSGGIILEFVALRDLQPNEELFLDYGEDWEKAWEKHVEEWKPPLDADKYVYPAEMDETQQLRTVGEQKSKPYPDNLVSMCLTPDWSSRTGNRTIVWYEPAWDWWRGLTYCHIIDRQRGPDGNDYYTVSLEWSWHPESIEFDPSKPKKDLYIDTMVPRRAIRFIEKPYQDDEVSCMLLVISCCHVTVTDFLC